MNRPLLDSVCNLLKQNIQLIERLLRGLVQLKAAAHRLLGAYTQAVCIRSGRLNSPINSPIISLHLRKFVPILLPIVSGVHQGVHKVRLRG